MEAARAIGAELLAAGEKAEGTANLRGWIEAHFAGADQFLGSG
jgi:hypothetical protein